MTLSGDLRARILDMHFAAKAGHIGCSLSCIDLMIVALIELKRESDSFILSKGHAASALYSCLNYLGEVSENELQQFYKNGTNLSAHPAPLKFKSVPFATGSLGHGLPVGAGIAKANKLKVVDGCAYVLMSDGETNEGTTWEAIHFAVKHRLDNLIVLIDKNKLQGFGRAEDVLGDTCKEEVFRELGMDVCLVNGHDIPGIKEAVIKLKSAKNGKPKVIVADTIKGRGVSFMENKLEWHYLPMNEIQYKDALSEIRKKYKS